MAQSDILKRYLEAGMAFTQMTRERAEAIVDEWVRGGEERREAMEERIEELLEWSRRNTEELVGLVQREVTRQLRSMGLDDLARRGSGRQGGGGATTSAPAAGAATAPQKSAAKKSAAKKSAAKKSAPKKAAAKKSAAKKSAAKGSAPKKSAAKKSAAQKQGG